MADQVALDAAIAALAQDVAAQTTIINNAVQAIIDKIAGSGAPPIDFQPEIDQLTAAKTALDAVAGQLPSAPTPPPGP